MVIQKLNPVLNGWCTYFRVGNSNWTFHKVDWAVRSELKLGRPATYTRSWTSCGVTPRLSFRARWLLWQLPGLA
jgi:hypothetical protein